MFNKTDPNSNPFGILFITVDQELTNLLKFFPDQRLDM